MPSPSAVQRIAPSGRSFTWPTTTVHVAPSFSRGMSGTYMSSPRRRLSPSALASASPTSTPPPRKPVCDPFEDEIDQHPDAHFLSPVHMYEYEDWASDSDDGDDDTEVAWDAGITDFALFDSDRRRAEERHELMPNHWDHLLNSQAMALQRAVQRNRSSSDPTAPSSSAPSPTTHASHPDKSSWDPLVLDDECPSLTPDTSPQLRDHLDMESPFTRPSSHRVPDYLSARVALHASSGDACFSSDEELDDSISSLDDDEDDDDLDFDDEEDDDDYETPLSVLLARSRERQRQARRLDRPGLRSSRTMSGKVHVWRRPSRHIYPVGEDVEAERRAELGFA